MEWHLFSVRHNILLNEKYPKGFITVVLSNAKLSNPLAIDFGYIVPTKKFEFTLVTNILTVSGNVTGLLKRRDLGEDNERTST